MLCGMCKKQQCAWPCNKDKSMDLQRAGSRLKKLTQIETEDLQMSATCFQIMMMIMIMMVRMRMMIAVHDDVENLPRATICFAVRRNKPYLQPTSDWGRWDGPNGGGDEEDNGDGDDEEDDGEKENSMGNQGSVRYDLTHHNKQSQGHWVLTNKQEVIVPPLFFAPCCLLAGKISDILVNF